MIPQDPHILLSYVNTMLRDNYSSLESFCDDKDISVEEITEKLRTINYEYNPEHNKFI